MASIFGALSTAISGLTAQSAAFSTISDNIANSQTTGFKASTTNFSDYLTTSTASINDSGFVSATPEYDNSKQGTISGSTNTLALAISGNGFFQVNSETATGNGTTTLSTQPEYTRDGNFTANVNGYLVNDANQALDGYTTNPATGIANTSVMAPIRISQAALPPTATANLTLSANLPATPSSTTPASTQVQVYDAQGVVHQVSLSYTQTAANTWSVAVSAPDATTPALGTAQFTFGSASGNPVTAGTIGSISGDTGSVTSSAFAANGPATLSFTANFGNGPQAVNVNLGNYGGATGLTQFAGTAYTLNQVTQDGTPPGNYTGVAIQANGNVVVSYDNNQARTVAQIPLTKFANANGLQRQDGQAFTQTQASGIGVQQTAGTGEVGNLVTGSTEGSTVDIATQFTKLIVAQQAYSANAKVVTTADQLLQATLNMKT